MNTIPLAQLGTMGGYQDKPYMAPPSILNTYGLDIFKNPGLLSSVNNSVEVDPLTKPVYSFEVTAIVHIASNKAYVFTQNRVYYWTPQSGTYIDLGAIGTGTSVAILFGDYVYFGSDTLLGRIDINAGPFGTVDASWKTFSSTQPYRSMVTLDGVLYISNGYYVAIVDEATVFVDDALDIQTHYNIRALYGYGNELYIGAENLGQSGEVMIFRWNTWSESFSAESIISEDYIYGLFVVDGKMYVFTSSIEGSYNFYFYSEPGCFLYCGLKTQAQFNRGAMKEWNNKVYLGFSAGGSSIKGGGVWVFGSVVQGANPVYAHMHTIPGSNSVYGENVSVGCISPSKSVLYFSFQNNDTNNRGIATDSGSRKNIFSIETSVIKLVPGYGKLPMIRLYFQDRGSSGKVTCNALMGSSANSTQEMLLDSMTQTYYTGASLPEDASHKIVLEGTGGYCDVYGVDISFN